MIRTAPTCVSFIAGVLGGFTSHAQLGAEHRFIHPTGGHALAIHDVDGDGDGDLLREVGGHLLLHRQVSPQAFLMEADLGQAGTVHCIRMADIDGDGVEDVVFPNTTGNRIGTALGLGGGSFAQVTDLVTGINSPYRVEAADLDGDGDLDLVHSRGGTSSVIAWSANQGGGSFNGSTTLSSGTFGNNYYTEYESRFAIGDIDLDGDVDVAVRNPGLAWLENDGAGNFNEHPITGSGSDLALGDMDGDADLDLVLIYQGSGLSRIPNNGDGTFGNADLLYMGPSDVGYLDLVLSDADGDGDPDVFFQSNGPVAITSAIHGMLNDGNGSLTSISPWPHYFADDYRHYAVGHLDGDVLIDGVAHMNDGIRAGFSATDDLVRITSFGPLTITPVDVNNDGAMDAMVSRFAPWSPMDEGPWPWGLATHLNNGGGAMQEEPQAPVPEAFSTRVSVAADVDGDGDQDIAALWQEPTVGTSRRWQLLINDNGVMDTSEFLSYDLAPAGIPAPLEFADVDDDGDADAVYASGSSRVMLNDGNGDFAALGTYWLSGTEYIPMCFTLMDMDGDGDPDHVWGHGSIFGTGGTDSLFWNANDGTGAVGSAQFAALAPVSVVPNAGGAYEYRVLRHPDLDLDGTDDLLIFNNDSIGVMRGTGTGAFTDGYALQAPLSNALATGDLNGDLLPDLIAITDEGDILFWPNLGNCSFGTMSVVATALTQSGIDDIALADMDNDGDLDVLTCSEQGAAAWLENSGDLPTSTAVARGRTALSIFPNPMTERARLVFPCSIGKDERIDVVDINGGIVERIAGNGSCELMVEGNGLPPGIYVLRVAGAPGMGSARLVVR